MNCSLLATGLCETRLAQSSSYFRSKAHEYFPVIDVQFPKFRIVKMLLAVNLNMIWSIKNQEIWVKKDQNCILGSQHTDVHE